ncbi:MAG TPA: aminoglycoside phosphotransferase family protein [Streptosporangiaceae bacterium]|jgi:thiamine kinase-like enzyme
MNGFPEALKQACSIVGLDADSARLLRLGSNAVYRLADPVVARISRPGTEIGPVRRTVAVARWLESVDYPAVQVVDVDQPILADGYVVTFWKAISDDGDQYASTPEIAEILARLHTLIAPEELHLPQLQPFANAEQRINASTWVSEDDRSFLTMTLARLREEYAGLEFVLPPGVIHGDAGVGNVLRDDDGNPVLIDLDGFAIGPREWDLALTAIYYDSFGWHTSEEYEDFARVYGFDIMRWPGYPVMRSAREFLMVTWLIQKAAEDNEAAAEARKRISDLRTGASRKDWRPY